jgi:hypothetical protein
MKSSWQTETGHLACHWSEAGQSINNDPRWTQENSEMHSSCLPPVPDFASHSPFGWASWFQPYIVDRDLQ